MACKVFDINAVFSDLPVVTEKTDKIQQAIKIVEDYMISKDTIEWVVQESEAELIINCFMKEHYRLTNNDCKMVMKYFLEHAPQAKKAPKQRTKKQELRAKALAELGQVVIDDDAEPCDAVDLDEEGISQEMQDAAKEKALDILKNGDPIQYIKDCVAKIHTGDDIFIEAMCISTAGQSCRNTDGLQLGSNGAPGSGKSHSSKAYLHHLRAKHKVEATISAKGLYYAHLKPGITVFSDDTEPDEAMEQTIKRANTNYQETTLHYTVKDQESKVVSIPPRTNFIFNSVESNQSTQMLSRQFKYNTNDSQKQKDSITQMQLKAALKAEHGLTEMNEDVLTCRYIHDEIKKNLFKVAIPFARRIWICDNRDARNTNMFLDMIKGYTIFKFMQRETDKDGNLLATEEDFNRACNLFSTQLETAITKYSEEEIKVLKYLAKEKEPKSTSDIADNTQIPYNRVCKMLVGRKDRVNSGLLEKVRGLTVDHETRSTLDGTKSGKYYCLKEFDFWASYDNKFATLLDGDLF